MLRCSDGSRSLLRWLQAFEGCVVRRRNGCAVLITSAETAHVGLLATVSVAVRDGLRA